MPAMALDRLTVINDALLATANAPINALNDGSDEWISANAAFDRAVKYLISENVWNFATTVADLVGADSNPFEARFTYAFVRPSAAWLIRTVWWKKLPYPDYEVIGNVIVANVETDLSCEFVRAPTDAEVPPWFQELLTQCVEIGVLRSLNEDFDEAMRRETRVRGRIGEVRSLENRQSPPRTGFNGKMRLARRSRRGGARRPAAGETFP